MRKIYFWEVILLLLLGVIPLLWYKPGFIAFGHDMGFPLAPIDHFIDRFYTWSNRNNSFGSDQTDSLNGVFIHGLEALASVGLPLIQAQQATFIFWFLLPAFTMYFLLLSLYPKKEDFVLRISGSVFYVLNYYMIQAWSIAERTKFSIVAALPLVILVLINVFLKRSSVVKQAAFISIVLFFLNGGSGIPLWGGLLLVGATGALVLVILSRDKLTLKLKRLGSFVLLSFVFLLILNLYWLLPGLQSYQQNVNQRIIDAGGIERVTEWSAVISKNASFINLFKMQGIPDWYENPEHPYSNTIFTNPLLILLGIITPIIAFIGALHLKSDGRPSSIYKILFLSLLITAIPFSAGSHFPTGNVYDFLLVHVPGFSIFRTPIYKFGMVLWFAYSFLTALGLQRISIKIKRPYLVLMIFLVAVGIYHYPAFTGVFFNWSPDYSTMVKVPPYIFEAKKELEKNKFSTRTLLVPYLNPGNAYEIYDWRYFSLSTVPSMLSRSPIVINNNFVIGNERPLLLELYNDLAKDGNSHWISDFGIDRVIVRNDFASPSEWGYYPTAMSQKVKNSDQFVWEKDMGKWEIFQVKEPPRPIIYLTEKMNYVSLPSSSLEPVLNFSGFASTGDTFFITPVTNLFIKDRSEKVKEQEPSRDLFSKFVIAGKCISCSSLNKDYVISSELPSSLPGTLQHRINRFFFLRTVASETPGKAIGLLLKNLLRDMAGLRLKILNPIKGDENFSNIEYVLDNARNDLNMVRGQYLLLDDAADKRKYSEQIYDYANFLISQHPVLLKQAKQKLAKEKLEQFNNFTASYLEDLGLTAPFPKEDNLVFGLTMPEAGLYTVHINSNAPYSSRAFKQISVGQKVYQTSLDSTTNSNLVVYNIPLDKGSNIVSLEGREEKNVFSLPSLDIFTKGNQTSCQEIVQEHVDSTSKYSFRFNYTGDGAYLMNVFLVQDSEQTGEAKSMEILSPTTVEANQTFKYQTEYVPLPGVSSFTLRFCAIPGSLSGPITAKVLDLHVDSQPNIPTGVFVAGDYKEPETHAGELEFISLNQTKYLVRINQISSPAVLVFNSRYDSGWELREIDQNMAAEYLVGQPKKYEGYEVQEYPRLDKHILTKEFIFGKDNKEPKHFKVNAFANAWELNDAGSRMYILKYRQQNTFYIATTVSLLGFVFLVVIYMAYPRKK